MDSLLRQIAGGDARATERFVDAYGGLVWSMAGRYLDRADEVAADVVQEIFVEIWMSAGRFDPARGPEVAFVTTIARRRLIDAQRRITRRRRLEGALPPEAGPGGSSGDAGATAAEPPSSTTIASAGSSHGGDDAVPTEHVLGAFDRLPDDERTVLWLFLHHGLSHSQISTATSAPIGTVKTRIRRGLLRLREALHAPASTEEAAS